MLACWWKESTSIRAPGGSVGTAERAGRLGGWNTAAPGWGKETRGCGAIAVARAQCRLRLSSMSCHWSWATQYQESTWLLAGRPSARLSMRSIRVDWSPSQKVRQSCSPSGYPACSTSAWKESMYLSSKRFSCPYWSLSRKTSMAVWIRGGFLKPLVHGRLALRKSICS